MKKKRLKIKWVNVIKLILFIICMSVIAHDLFMITIYGWLHDTLVGFTWYGLLTFMLVCSIACMIYEDFEEEIEKASTTGNSQR